MILKTEYAVPHQVYFDAKHYVEQNRVLFFDFFRNCAFGFIRTGDKSGHYAHLIIEDNGQLMGFCSCAQVDEDEVCGHAFALYLLSLNWPFEKVNLSDAFEKDPLCTFLKNVGRPLYGKPLDATTNPAVCLPEGLVPKRLAQYWDLQPVESEPLRKRDQELLTKAMNMTRTRSEKDMLKKGFPPARVLFEDSRLYVVCKLLYRLQRKTNLKIRVELDVDHQVRLKAVTEGHRIFEWLLSVDAFIKGVGADWTYWEPYMTFPIRRQALPILYRIGFSTENDLQIEPKIEVASDEYVPLADVLIPSTKNLYYHERAGYFRVQTGLSTFEMEFSTPHIHRIDHQEVKNFLKEHGETIKSLDRTLIDEGLFGEVVVEFFRDFTLTLLDFEDGHFHYEMTARLGDKQFEGHELRSLFHSSGRYRKIAGKLFDTSGYDGVYLKPLFEADETKPRLSVSELLRLICFFKDRLTVSTTDLSEQVFVQVRDYRSPNPPSLDHTRLDLRAYQQAGYHWLYFLKSFGLGGLLCDQMGLGKTHQGMALLAATLRQNPSARVLVVAPASVIYHWRDKLRAFCPTFSATLHYGPDREVRSALNHQVVVSTYHTLRNDAETLTGTVFELILFDEIQNLKNKSTKSYQNLAKLQGQCKIGLTGTPVENHIGELKALLDLVYPGLLGSDGHFKRYFLSPIMDSGRQDVKQRLQQMVNPFTLRRNKQEVLAELPEKIEDLRTVTMNTYEAELYREVQSQGRSKLAELKEGSGLLHMFTVIDQLKRVCNHPALYFKNTEYDAYPSAKWDMFLELLSETLESGEKLVVFTQYLGMIDLFARYLTDHGISYASITGQTRDRDVQQSRFQNDPDCQVFLGTVRAAGTGIELTSASVLIHYDRWWNAAREEQATDRIHRMGQKQVVQIYKFRTLDSVEERIDAIIERKRLLMDELVAFDEEGFTKVFNVDELLEILG